MADVHKQAEKDYTKGMKYREIAEKYSVSINTVKSWKQRHGWTRKKGVHTHIERKVHTKIRGAPAGNKNEKGYGAPAQNQNIQKHGLLLKVLPQETKDLMDAMTNLSNADLI